MLGAIAGDIIESVYEKNVAWHSARNPNFEPLFAHDARFTDDTVLPVSVADAVLNGGDLVTAFKDYARAYPDTGYGGTFKKWARSDNPEPYNSWCNGLAMRVSPVAYAYDSLDVVLERARWTAEVTHNHPEGVAGAQATAVAVFLARTGHDKGAISDYVTREFGYDLETSIDEIRPGYMFDVSCRGSVPPAIRAFLESTNYEHAVRLAVSLGGDADTLACIAGSIAGAFYGVPDEIRLQAIERLDGRLRGVLTAFEARYSPRT